MIISADVHLGLSSDSVMLENMLPSKVQMTIDRLNYLVDVAAKEIDKSLILAGDIHDSPNPPAYISSLLLKAFVRAIEKRVSIYVIPGNHDCNTYWSSTQVPRSAKFSNLIVFDDDISYVPVAGFMLVFLPHLPMRIAREQNTSGSWADYISSKVKAESIKLPLVLIAHGQPDVDFESGSESVMEAGNAMTFDVAKLFKIFHYIFLGHIHKHQSLYGKLFIPGSLVMNSFSEVGEAKGYFVLKKGKTPIFVKFPKSKWEYCLLDLDISKGDSLPTKAEIKKMLHGNMVKVRLKIRNQLQVERKRITQLVESTGVTVCRFEVINAAKKRVSVSASIPKEDVHFSLDHDELLNTYIKSSKEDKKTKDVALSFGKKVVEKCLKS